MPGLTCEQAEGWMAAFIDNELDALERQQVQAHLDACPSCAAQLKAEASVRALVKGRRAALEETAPPHMKRSILQAVREEEARNHWYHMGRRHSLWVFAAAACLLIAVAGGVLYQSDSRAVNRVVASVVDEHIRCLMKQDGGLDVVAADPGEVSGWFRGRLAVNVVPPDFDSMGIELAGARLCYVLDRQGAQLVYRRGQHVVCLFTMDTNGVTLPDRNGALIDGHPARFAAYKGYNVVVWEDRGLLQALVADVSYQELRTLAESSMRS